LTRLPLARAAAEATHPSTSPGLWFPTAHTGEEGPRSAGGATTRFVPSSGFGYPPDGLLPSTPGRVCFIPTALLGFPPAELSPPGRWERVSPLAAPACRQTATVSGAGTAPAGIAITGYRALALPRSPSPRDRCLARRRLDAPLGFSPSRVILPTALHEVPTPRSPYVLRRKVRPKADPPAGT
jgi:hypothetical protein